MGKVVVVVGQGYVGLPLALEATLAGLMVVGLELNPLTVSALNSGRSHVDDVHDKDIRRMLELGYKARETPSVIADADVVVICVPTPLGDAGAPDLSAVQEASEAIARYLTPGTLVVLESTTYPGTTRDLVLPILEGSGLKLDEDFFLAFSPERIDPGNPIYGLANTPKVVGGVTVRSTAMATEFYGRFVQEVVPVRSSIEAETCKLLENTYRHINIALVNEMAKFCNELDIDLWNVIDAAKTKPFGFQAFYPGPGVGGHCIPIDPNYLSYQVERSLGYPFRFVELAEEVNNSMPAYVATRLQDLLNDAGMPVKGSSVLLLGVTYKANIADKRESPATPLAKILLRKGAELTYHDPRVATWMIDGTPYKCVEDLDAAVRGADVVVYLQDHNEYSPDALAQSASLFFDTRGVSTVPAAFKL